MLASEIIDAARGRHPAFDVTRTPNRVALQYLSAYAKQLHGKVASIDPEQVRDTQTTTLPLADHAAGIALQSNRMVQEVVAKDSSDLEYPVTLIPASNRLDVNTDFSSAWQVGSTLFLTSPATIWQRMTKIEVSFVPIPDRLTALTDSLLLPDTAELALTEAVAAFMARRAPKDAEVDAGEFASIAAATEAEFLGDITNRLSGMSFITRDTYRP